jgi:hypothetical protein
MTEPRVGSLALASSWLQAELRPFAGRAEAATRIALGVCLTAFLVLLFELPGLDIAAYIPLFTYRRDRRSTIKLGVAFGLFAMLAVGTTLPLWAISENRWALRFLVTFVTFDAMLIPKLGPLAFAIGSLTVLLLTFAGLVPDGEFVTTELLKAATSIAIAGGVSACIASVPWITVPEAEAAEEESEHAFTSSDRAIFAARGTIAVMLGFVIFNATDWFGIHTCMFTTLFIATPERERLLRKGALRIGGAAFGSLLALVAMVWVVPQLTDVAGFLAMVAIISLLAGWVAAGSERISYAGMQIGLAFFLGVLALPGPIYELSEARDRVIGVLLGVLLAWFAFAPGTLGLDWPFRRSPPSGRPVE